MPQMGESIAEGTVSRWLKKVGDEVKRDEPIFEISTDKVDAEIPSPAAGVLAEIVVGEGQTVAVDSVVARLETEKGALVAVATAAPAIAPATAPAMAPAMAPAAPPAAAATSSPRSAPPPPAPPAPAPRATANGGSLDERLRTKSSPLVRRIAADHGVELSRLSGSGIAGRVTKRDIMAFIEGGNGGGDAPHPAATATIAVPAADAHVPAATAWPGDVVEPMTKLRRLTFEHMAVAKRVAAHVTTVWEVDLTRVARIRARLRAEFEASSGQKLTYLPFIVHAVVQGLKRHPSLNSTTNGTDVIYRKRYNIGLAVALEPTGLIVPVIKHAEDLSLSGIAKAANDLAGRARARKLGPADTSDATFSITNFGTFGSIMGTPIIPVGTTAILGLGAIEKRPKVIAGAEGEDVIAVRTCAYFSLSFDHRLVDGADADRFMGDLKRTLESVPDAGF
ncbi:MAG TPA: dihydrolipoamide acetyltransferase family protein [Gemmatimonadaceae bacterium]|nr:dihydrolipoamide acetyltransferase family protein [Gemmatimonadaceae bacterium]